MLICLSRCKANFVPAVYLNSTHQGLAMYFLAADALPLILPPSEAHCRLHTKPKALQLVLYRVAACHKFSLIAQIH